MCVLHILSYEKIKLEICLKCCKRIEILKYPAIASDVKLEISFSHKRYTINITGYTALYLYDENYTCINLQLDPIS